MDGTVLFRRSVCLHDELINPLLRQAQCILSVCERESANSHPQLPHAPPGSQPHSFMLSGHVTPDLIYSVLLAVRPSFYARASRVIYAYGRRLAWAVPACAACSARPLNGVNVHWSLLMSAANSYLCIANLEMTLSARKGHIYACHWLLQMPTYYTECERATQHGSFRSI